MKSIIAMAGILRGKRKSVKKKYFVCLESIARARIKK